MGDRLAAASPAATSAGPTPRTWAAAAAARAQPTRCSPGAGQGDRGGPVGGVEQEPGPALAVQLDPLGPHLGARAQPEQDHPGHGAVGHGRHLGVVGVEHGRAVGREGLDQLPLGLGDRLPGAEHAQVGLADVEDHPDGWPGQAGQGGDVAGAAGAHLDHHRLGAGLDPGQGQGQADLVVERRLVGHGLQAGGQDGGEQVLGGGLAVGPGDRHHGGRRPVPHGRAEGGQGGQRVGDLDPGPGEHGALLGQGGDRAGPGGGGREQAAVGAAARQGHEQVPRPRPRGSRPGPR